jgi:TPR repeat protein
MISRYLRQLDQFVKRYLTIVSTVLVLGTAWADDFSTAMEAYSRQDYSQALQYFKSSASQGDSAAQYNVGQMYDKGNGVEQNFAETFKWFRMAAIQGNVEAQFNIGQMYGSAQGVMRDYAEAVKWYQVAASQGNVSAQFNLGAMYHQGKGVVQDYVHAHAWLNLAAVSGHANAIKYRDRVSHQMTAQQISEAQKLAVACKKRNFKHCD